MLKCRLKDAVVTSKVFSSESTINITGLTHQPAQTVGNTSQAAKLSFRIYHTVVTHNNFNCVNPLLTICVYLYQD